MALPKNTKGAPKTLYINEYRPNNWVEYKTGINKLIAFILRLFNKIEKFVYLGKSINLLARANSKEVFTFLILKFEVLHKYIGAIKEEINFPISKPNIPDFINGKLS